jgi:hypothetical protein
MKIIQKEKMNSNDFEIMSNAIDKWYSKHYEKGETEEERILRGYNDKNIIIIGNKFYYKDYYQIHKKGV